MLAIHPVLIDDYAQLAVFLADFPLETRRAHFWLKRFNLWWDGNPAFGPEAERGWVLHHEQNIVGFLGMIPSRLQLLGRETRVFSTTTWRVLPLYRNQSLQLFFKATNMARKSMVFCTTPSGPVREMLEPLRFRSIPRPDDDSPDPKVDRSVIITNVGNFLKAKLSHKLRPNFLTKMVVPPLIPLVQIFQTRRLATFMTTDAPRATQVKWADRAFDDLWARTKSSYLNTNIRSADVVNWYCFGNVSYAKELFGCFRGDELLGYAIFWRKHRGRLKTLECVDLWVEPAETAVITSLVRCADEYARENSLDLLVFPHFTEDLKKHFTRLGLLRVKFLRRREYFKADAPVSTEINACNSYFVGFQGDYGL